MYSEEFQLKIIPISMIWLRTKFYWSTGLPELIQHWCHTLVAVEMSFIVTFLLLMYLTLLWNNSKCLKSWFLFEMGGITSGILSSPGLSVNGHWKSLIPVLWNDDVAIVELGHNSDYLWWKTHAKAEHGVQYHIQQNVNASQSSTCSIL